MGRCVCCTGPDLAAGLGKQGGAGARVGNTLVRDVFVAADMLHEDAMSEMGGSTSAAVGCGGGVNADADVGAGSTSEGSTDNEGRDEGEREGERWSDRVPCSRAILCLTVCIAETDVCGRALVSSQTIMPVCGGPKSDAADCARVQGTCRGGAQLYLKPAATMRATSLGGSRLGR